MATPSAARVNDKYTGEATVIDNTAFYNTMYNIQKDIVTQKKAKELELKKQNQAWDTLLENMPDVWQADSEYVNKSLNEYNDFIIDLKARGLDPNDLDVTTMKKMRELENNVAKAASFAKDNEAYYNQAFAELNRDKEGKYNKQHATDWFKTYADPKLSPQERYKLRNEGNPFKINHSLIELIDKTIPKPGVTDTGKKKVTSRDATEHKSVVLDYIMNDPVGKEKYESLKKDGEDEVAFAERIAKEGQSRYPIIEDLQTGSTKKTGTGSTGTKDKKPSIKVSTKDTDPKYDQNLGINKILYENTKPVYVKDVNGKTVDNFEPSGGFKISPDGNVYAIGTGKDDQGGQIDVTVNYGQNKEQFDVAGYTDVFQDFYNKNNQKASGTTGGAKTIKRSDIPAKARAAGYTDAEYEKMLIQKGVKIVD
jgi:hypothetical protein